MNHPIRRTFASVLIMLTITGCPKKLSGPTSVTETSIERAALDDRVQFIENYVTFRRQYDKLEYDVTYQNNGGGMVPGPSDWDIQLLAAVPLAELDSWVPEGATKSDVPPPDWLLELPGSIERQGVTEWYRNSGIEVGIDRENSLVAYRNTTMPD